MAIGAATIPCRSRPRRPSPLEVPSFQGTACSSDGQCWLILGAQSFAHANLWTYAIGEKDGHWMPPYRLGGPHFQLRGHDQTVYAYISCSLVSSCTVAGGQLQHDELETFVQTEVGDRWGPALPIPRVASGPAVPFKFAFAANAPIYCTAPDTCLLAGTGKDQGGAVDQEVDGRSSTLVSGIGLEAPYVQSIVERVACHTDALCVATGYSYTAGQLRVLAFAQVEVKGHWLRPLLLRGLGNTGNGAMVDGAQCPTASTCDVIGQFRTTDTSTGRTLSFEATYSASQWHYWIVSLGSRPDQTYLLAMSCAGGRCWVTGSVYGKGGTSIEGVVFPLTAPSDEGSHPQRPVRPNSGP
jgi:hypothetical protein